MKACIVFIAALFTFSHTPLPQTVKQSGISGIVLDSASGKALELTNVVVLRVKDKHVVTGKTTDVKGRFLIDNVPAGEYFLKYSLMGYQEYLSGRFSLDKNNLSFDAGTVRMRESRIKLNEVTVTSQKEIFNNSIDRKVYNVQQDIVSSTGSVSDLLQNIPSIQLDVDGNVTLRGSSNMQILVDGQTSPLMSGNSADVLQQIPASSVDKIEVITNPSAKYKPDGTAGIINIVLKKDSHNGFNGSVGANAGNSSRYGARANINYKSGDLNLFGSYNLRKDTRYIYSNDTRHEIDSATNLPMNYDQSGTGFNRPINHFFTFGFDYTIGQDDKTGISANYRARNYTSNDFSLINIVENNVLSSNYNRDRIDYDKTTEGGLTAYYQHQFDGEDNSLRIELHGSSGFDQEDNRYTNIYHAPQIKTTYDNTLIKNMERAGEVSAEYHFKSADNMTIEAGYNGSFGRHDFPFSGEYFDTLSQKFINDAEITNHYLYKQEIHAFYSTIETEFGNLGLMGGLRLEKAYVTSDLVLQNLIIPNDYFKLYPTLHLAYKLTELTQLQLNYSLRANRPESDDMNPFPEYQNPRNLRAGNPKLKPEYIHSVEFGYEIQNDNLTIVPSIYFRQRYNAFTSVAKMLNDTTVLNTRENLSSDKSAGLELVIAGNLGSIGTMNLSTSGFYQEIDASNLGYGAKKSDLSWTGSLNCSINIIKSLSFQINSNYRSQRLTPQGEGLPTYVVNFAVRQELIEGKLSLTGTISNAFNSFKREMKVNTNILNQHTIYKRDSRIIMLGIVYNFGNSTKRTKDKQAEFDSTE